MRDLDKMVRDPADPQYQKLRKELRNYVDRACNPNPFGAGAPPQYTDREWQEIKDKYEKGGVSMRKIAEEMGCSVSTVYRAVHYSRY